MVSLGTWCRYVAHKFVYSLSVGWKSYKIGQITETQVGDTVWKNLFQGKMTYLHWNKGDQMAPTLVGEGGILLVRKLPTVDPIIQYPIKRDTQRLPRRRKSGSYLELDFSHRNVFVGDVVVLKDPENPEDHLVRRLAAIEGYEMASTDEKDEPFVLEKDQCWVVADNESVKPKEARDSRSFGPVPVTDIVGRAIYSLRTPVDHGPVQNSEDGMYYDSPVLAVELDVAEMAKNIKS